METIQFFGKNIQVLDSADVVVIGGGVAGSVAAISALNEHQSCIIIEKSNALGGTATNGLVIPFMRSYVSNPNGLNVSLNKEYLHFDKNAELNGGKENAMFANPVTYAMFYDQKVRSLKGQIYYDATFIDVIMEGKNIQYAIVYIHNELFAIKGKCFVDCSAEGVLAKAVGCELMHGNEARNHIHQSVSLRYEMGGVDKVKLCDWLRQINYQGFGIPQNPQNIEFVRDSSLFEIMNKAIENNEVTIDDMRYLQAFRVPGKANTFAFNGPQLGEKYNSDDPKEYSTCISEGLASIYRYSNFMIHHIPGFEHAYITHFANQLGIRESVRVKTKYILQNEDYTNRARFEDGIAKADWYVDTHSDSETIQDAEEYNPGEYYEVPYRSLITNECENLIIGGRIIGASFRVEASVRIQITLRDISEVIGKACAYSINHQVPLNAIDGKIFKVKY